MSKYPHAALINSVPKWPPTRRGMIPKQKHHVLSKCSFFHQRHVPFRHKCGRFARLPIAPQRHGSHPWAKPRVVKSSSQSGIAQATLWLERVDESNPAPSASAISTPDHRGFGPGPVPLWLVGLMMPPLSHFTTSGN